MGNNTKNQSRKIKMSQEDRNENRGKVENFFRRAGTCCSRLAECLRRRKVIKYEERDQPQNINNSDHDKEQHDVVQSDDGRQIIIEGLYEAEAVMYNENVRNPNASVQAEISMQEIDENGADRWVIIEALQDAIA